MMGGEAFILLKAGRPERESVKQAEIRLADLRKILSIAAALWPRGNGRPANQPLALISSKNG